jgi:hypothetical protein
MIPDTTGMFAGGISPNISAGAGIDPNAAMSLILLGQSFVNKGQNDALPIDFAGPSSSYIGNISKAKALNRQEKKDDQLMSLIKEALNPETTSKLTVGPNGATMAYDPKTTPWLKNVLSGEQDPFEAVTGPKVNPLSSVPTPSVSTPPAGGGSTVTSPFVPIQPTSSGFSDITPGDLAGLTTKDITDILGAKHDQEKLKQQSYRDIVDAMYKGAVIKREGAAHITDKAYKEALTLESQHRITKENMLDKPFPINALGKVGGTSVREWNALTPDQQNYAGYVHTAKQLGDKDIMTPQQFKQNLNPNEQIGFLEELSKRPDLMKIKKELLTAGATQVNIPQTVERQEALDKVKRQSEVQDPGLPQKIVKQLSADRINWSDPLGTAEMMKKYPNATREQIVKALQDDMLRNKLNEMIIQAYPGAKWEAGKGWTTKDGEFIRGDI